MLPDRFETTRLILRPIEPQDAPAIFTGYAQDPEVVRFLIWRPHQGIADSEAYIARCMAAPPDGSRTYTLIGRDDGRLRGAFELRRPEPHRLDCGYVLAHTFWGRGLMTEALQQVAHWAMRQDGIWGSVLAVTSKTSRLPASWRRRGSQGRAYFAAGSSTRMSARSREIG